MRTNVFDKLAALKAAVQTKVEDVPEDYLIRAIDHINRHNEGTRTTNLTVKEQLIHSVLLEEGIKGRTAMVWLRASYRWPKQLRDDVKAGNLSLTKAMAIAKDYHINTDKERNAKVMGKIRRYVADIHTGHEAE